MMSGNLEVIFLGASREDAPLVEELWKDKALQATYNRRNELDKLPRLASYFLDRVRSCSAKLISWFWLLKLSDRLCFSFSINNVVSHLFKCETMGQTLRNELP